MKALSACYNGDGRPIQPPSKVLCRECFAALDVKLRAVLTRLTRGAQDRAGKGEG